MSVRWRGFGALGVRGVRWVDYPREQLLANLGTITSVYADNWTHILSFNSGLVRKD
ncbi:hypothetical protein SAMN05660282_00102 [Corynebacterium spheniscorum]|uniref:Uncharacterized protein n=1 Tax=Corynebacterium spheniscorum TaxID=185761 RepID=A0A1I2PN59_9CORY|nr:hypothetical protein SAMN05660282_00102 [Corynebacterium spheniscorum]